MYFDSHCHLDFDTYDGVREKVWNQARSKGITRALIPGTTPTQWSRLPELCNALSGASYAVGLHPWWIKEDLTLRAVVNQLRDACEGAVAIGETGLDKTKRAQRVSLDLQHKYFQAHVRLAADVGLPLIIHCVNAHETMLEALKQLPLRTGGAMHSFSGSAEVAQRYLEHGLHISFSCSSLGFGDKKTAAIACVPDELLLIETDAPDQSAERDRPGSVLDVIEVAKKVAKVRGADVETIARLTTANARRLFRV